MDTPLPEFPEQPPPPDKAAVRQRKRAAKACDGCRRQKEKCDGGVPCRRCTRLRRVCVFSGGRPSSTRAGPRSIAAAQGSEPAQRPESSHRSPSVSAEPDSADLADRVLYLERIVRQYTGNVNFDSDTLRTLAENADKQQQPALPSGLAPPTAVSTPSHDESAGFEEGSFCIKPLENNMTHYSGEFSHWNFSMRIKQWIDQTAPNDGPNRTLNSAGVREYYRAEELQPLSSIAISAAALPPRFVANFLVQAFFTHGQANYWHVEREWLLAKLDAVYDDVASLTRRDVGTVCMIFMVLAIGTQYAYLDLFADSKADAAHAQRHGRSADSALFSEDAIGVMFYQQACRLLPDVITISSLESVQACLLIGIYTLPIDASGLSYVYLNLAVKLAIQNGMHRRYLGEDLDPTVRETRNRVWWTAYTIERRVGIFHGRPISISDKDVDADMPNDNLGLLSSTTSDHASHLLATLRLNQILSKISQAMLTASSQHQRSDGMGTARDSSGPSPRTHARQQSSSGMAQLLELHRELVSWWDALPDTMSCKDTTPQTSVSRLGVHLKLEYCLVRIFMGRAFIFPQDKTSSSSSPPDSAMETSTPTGAAAAPSPRSTLRSTLVTDCIDASLDVIDTCRRLRDTIGLARASYTEFSSCRAALLVITAQCLRKKTDRFRRTLREGLPLLKEMSAGVESAQSELSLIEAFERAIAKLDAAPAGAKGDGRGDGDEEVEESPYTRFKRWEQMWKTDQSMGDQAGLGGLLPMGPLSWESRGPPPLQQQHVSSATPFFGMDGNFASFPQTLDEFSMCLGFNLGPSPQDSGNANTAGGAAMGDDVWEGSMGD